VLSKQDGTAMSGGWRCCQAPTAVLRAAEFGAARPRQRCYERQAADTGAARPTAVLLAKVVDAARGGWQCYQGTAVIEAATCGGRGFC
jgi:hypothetical protein